MPLIEIHMLKGRSKKQKKTLLESVTRAVQESLEVPVSSIRIWIQEIPADEFMAEGKLKSDKKKGD